MKLMYCAECGDIKSMDRNGKPTTCRCGNFTAWWVDPARGTVKARAWDRENVRFIGIDNRFLESSWRIDPQSSKAWRDIQDIIVNNADGYLFSKDKRNCPVVLIKVGESTDISWDIWQPESEKPINYEI